MMNREEKLEIIADILEVEADELQEDMVLDDFETWDSVAVLSVIAMMDEKFGKYPHASEIRQYIRVIDLMNSME
ncbi:MAG: acyl carrier protein [Eubacterium sp.]|jgi:acyl carrier protein|nr:acyl carrier protein [Eubacterium sp.]MCI9410885.1 acyl carrier protein [Eubacterium sp.]MCI9537913.1 acyl carrier protein [Eubacterium sp.]